MIDQRLIGTLLIVIVVAFSLEIHIITCKDFWCGYSFTLPDMLKMILFGIFEWVAGIIMTIPYIIAVRLYEDKRKAVAIGIVVSISTVIISSVLYVCGGDVWCGITYKREFQIVCGIMLMICGVCAMFIGFKNTESFPPKKRIKPRQE